MPKITTNHAIYYTNKIMSNSTDKKQNGLVMNYEMVEII